jgi:hypothetical protein
MPTTISYSLQGSLGFNNGRPAAGITVRIYNIGFSAGSGLETPSLIDNEPLNAASYDQFNFELSWKEERNLVDPMDHPVVFDEGYLFPTGRVSTSGILRAQADRAVWAERAAASVAGDPYAGVPGHSPDTTWTRRPEPPFWQDLHFSIKSSLGRQALIPWAFGPQSSFTLTGSSLHHPNALGEVSTD